MTDIQGSCRGPGYLSPMDAFKHGPRETLLYVLCVRRATPASHLPDYLATVDVDPKSKDYGKVIHRAPMRTTKDEIHRSGWNACSSCFDNPNAKRNFLILPAMIGNRVYGFDCLTDPRAPKLAKNTVRPLPRLVSYGSTSAAGRTWLWLPSHHGYFSNRLGTAFTASRHTFGMTPVFDDDYGSMVIEAEDMERLGAYYPHTVHCLGSGEVMISYMGDSDDKATGGFVLLDNATLALKGPWEKPGHKAPMGCIFWYQPYYDVMISSEWGAPHAFKYGLNVEQVPDHFGRHLNVYSWKNRTLEQRIDLGQDGLLPLELAFLHNPLKAEGYVVCALSSTVFRFFKTQAGPWAAEKVISIPAKRVEGWQLPRMPALTADLVISMDDRFLYITSWLHGDVRQYDISDTRHPKLVGQVFVGGSCQSDSKVKVTEDLELKSQPKPLYVKGTRFLGGPLEIQLSLDGKRLYVTSSLFSPWDKQYYPEMVRKGGQLLQLDVNTDKGGLTVNQDFMVDFGQEPGGPAMATEMRYPLGDCTSDIWLHETMQKCGCK